MTPTGRRRRPPDNGACCARARDTSRRARTPRSDTTRVLCRKGAARKDRSRCPAVADGTAPLLRRPAPAPRGTRPGVGCTGRPPGQHAARRPRRRRGRCGLRRPRASPPGSPPARLLSSPTLWARMIACIRCQRAGAPGAGVFERLLSYSVTAPGPGQGGQQQSSESSNRTRVT